MRRSFKCGRVPPCATSTPARLLVLAVCACLVAATVASAAPPTPRWLKPVDISTPGTDALVPAISVDERGNVMAIWAQSMNGHWTVMAARRPASRPWSRPRAISSDAQDAASPQVAVDAVGNAVAVWQWFDGKNSVIQSAAYDVGRGRWSPPANLSQSGRDSVAPRLAVDGRGNAVAVWTTLSLAGWTVEATVRPPDGAWEKASDIISPAAGTASPDVAVDPSGNVVVVWAATTGTAWVVQASYRPVAGAWSSPTDLSQPARTESISPQVAIEPNGEAEVVWSRSSGASPVIEVSTRSANGAWSAAKTISSAGSKAVAPLIAVGEGGDAAVVWTSSGKSGLTATVVYRRAGGDWGRAANVSGASSGPLAPSVAIDRAGNVVVVWTRATGGRSLVQAASRDVATGTWTKPVGLSQVGADALTPDVALSPSGDGALVWSGFRAQGFVVQGVGYDVRGPDLTGVTVAQKGVVGRRLAFAVAPRDVWSGVKSVKWSFGDGSVANGKKVFHVYRRTGRFTVRVTATDAVGHSTTVGRSISIATR